jgi:hypothetical protein
MRFNLPVLLLFAVSCEDPLEATTSPDACVDGTPLTWANFGKPMFATWCVSCHAETISGADRNGAPLGLNLEHLDQVLPHLDRILATSATNDWTMPPSGGMSARDRERLREWIECGAPGTEEVLSPPCETLVEADVIGEDFCDRYNAFSGDLSTTEGLDCLCVVDGDLVVDGEASFPNLLEVAGDLLVAADIEAPSLHLVAGSVVVRGEATAVSLPSLRRAETLAVFGNSALTLVDFPRLTQLSGSMEVRDNPALEELRNLNALVEVGGDLVIARNRALNDLDGFHVLGAVGGSLIIEDNDAVESFYGFQGLETVGEHLSVSGNDQFERLGAFQDLVEVGGRLDVERNASLHTIDTFPWLEEVGAVLVVGEGALTLEENPLLDLITPGSFGSLHRANGLIIRGNPSLRTLVGFSSVQEVSGDFILSENNVLDLVCAFSELTYIGGEFQMISAPELPTCNAERVRERVVTVFGNSTIFGTDDLGTCERLRDVCG